MREETIRQVISAYQLDAKTIRPAQKGYRNEVFTVELSDGRLVNAIFYKRETDILDKIHNANYVSDFLAAKGLPARRTADPRIIRLRAGDYQKFAALYEYMPGATIPWEAYTMDHIKQLGAAMSDMHAALKPLPQGNLPFVIDECRALLKRMERYFADDGVHDALASKLDLALLDTTRLRPALTAAIDLPAQALHMDFVRGNILFDEHEKAKITGILDFEKAAWGPPVFDIARTLAFLIVDCKYKEGSKVRKYFLHSGYSKRGASEFAPSRLLEDLLDFFLLHDFYKFLRHNPYESLKQNEHFVRTRDFLLERNIIAATTPLMAAAETEEN